MESMNLFKVSKIFELATGLVAKLIKLIHKTEEIIKKIASECKKLQLIRKLDELQAIAQSCESSRFIA